MGIGSHVDMGIFHAVAYPSPGREIEYGREVVLLKNLFQGGKVFDITFDKGESFPTRELIEPVLLDPYVVVVVKVINTYYRYSGI